MIDWEAVGRHLRDAAEGNATAWQTAQAALHPELVRLARRQPIGRLKDDRDSAHDVAARVLERIHANEFRALKRLFASETEPVLQAWIRVLVRTTAIDLMRTHSEYQRQRDGVGGWISLVSLASNPGAVVPSSLVEKQREVERFLANAVDEAKQLDGNDDASTVLAARWQIENVHVRRLLQKGSRYLPVLQRVLAGQSHGEVADALSLTRREIELTVGYIEEFLAARGFGRPETPA